MDHVLPYQIGAKLYYRSGTKAYEYLGIFGDGDGDYAPIQHAVREVANARVYMTDDIEHYQPLQLMVDRYYRRPLDSNGYLYKVLGRYSDGGTEMYAMIEIDAKTQRTHVRAVRADQAEYFKEVD